MTSAPLWLVHLVGRHPLTVQATTSRLAVAQAERRGYTVAVLDNGLPVISYAGYAADESRPRPMPKWMAAKRRQRTGTQEAAAAHSGPLVRHAMEIYHELRAGFPLRSTLTESQTPPWALRDFLADMGSLLERCDPDDDLEQAMRGDDATGLGAALVLMLTLIDVGYSPADAAMVADRTRRVTVPAV